MLSPKALDSFVGVAEPPHFKSLVSPTLEKMFHRLCSGKKISGPRSCHWLMPVHLSPAPTPATFGFMIPVFPSWRVWKLHEYYKTVCTYCLAFPGVPISRTNKLTKLERITSPQRSLILTRFSFTPSYRRPSARFTLRYGIRRSHPRFLTWAVFPAVLATLLCDKAAIISDLQNSPTFPPAQLFRGTVC